MLLRGVEAIMDITGAGIVFQHGLQRLLLVIDTELVGEGFERVGYDGVAGLVARLQQMHDLAVEDLVGLGARLREDRATELGIGEQRTVLAFVDEAMTLTIDHHGIDIREAITAIGELARREIPNRR